MGRRRLKEGKRLAWLALGLAVLAAAVTWLASVGGRSSWWSAEEALAALPAVFVLAFAAVLLGLFARFRRSNRQLVAVSAVLLGLSVAGFLTGEKIRWASHPPLHDVTTNLDDPPSFSALEIRSDLLAGVPVHDRPGYAALTTAERWKAVHSEAYPDLRPLEVGYPPPQALERSASAARARGWKVVRVDPAQGKLEATATAPFLGFKDDLSVRVRPVRGRGSIVDARSVSRAGISDHGRGAGYIRRLFLGIEAAQ
jgi:hypothetical protein